MRPRIKTRQLFRLGKGVGIQIVATVRPDKDQKRLRRKILKLVMAGVSHIRLNLSHFSIDDENVWEAWLDLLRCIDDIRSELGVPVGVMLDTAGPEFRIDGETALDIAPGERFWILADQTANPQGVPAVCLSMPEGFESFGGPEIINREIRFNDGQGVAVVVKGLGPRFLLMEAKHSLRFAKGGKVNFPNLPLRGVVSVSFKDQRQLEFLLSIPRTDFAREHNPDTLAEFIPIDFVAQSFVRFPEDVRQLSTFLAGLNLEHQPLVIAKIETKHAAEVRTLRQIIALSETAAVMIARGDLASECERWQVPAKQREIIRIAHSRLKPVLIATEVYGSMGNEPFPWQPSRGEVVDVRHALEAAADGIVFTKETGARPDPETTVEYLATQASHDEKDIKRQDLWRVERENRRHRLTKALRRARRESSVDRDWHLPWQELKDLSTADFAMGGVFRANDIHVPIVAVTVNGKTVANLIHFLPYGPVIAITFNPRTLARLALFGHVHPVLVDGLDATFDVQDLKDLVQEIMEKFSIGDQAVALMPHPVGLEGGLDTQILVSRQAAHPKRYSNFADELGIREKTSA